MLSTLNVRHIAKNFTTWNKRAARRNVCKNTHSVLAKHGHLQQSPSLNQSLTHRQVTYSKVPVTHPPCLPVASCGHRSDPNLNAHFLRLIPAGPHQSEAGMNFPVQDRSCDPTHKPLGHATDSQDPISQRQV
jgi:hypothetical protein